MIMGKFFKQRPRNFIFSFFLLNFLMIFSLGEGKATELTLSSEIFSEELTDQPASEKVKELTPSSEIFSEELTDQPGSEKTKELTICSVLPPEILTYIFSFLDFKSLNKGAGATNRFFCTLSQQDVLWEPLVKKNFDVDETLLFEHEKNLLKGCLDGIRPGYFKDIFIIFYKQACLAKETCSQVLSQAEKHSSRLQKKKDILKCCLTSSSKNTLFILPSDFVNWYRKSQISYMLPDPAALHEKESFYSSFMNMFFDSPTKSQVRKIEGFIDRWDPFKNFHTLSLRNQQLFHLPHSFSQLERLKFLDLSGNQFTHLPVVIGNLPSLRILNVRGNPLVSLPSTFSELCRLRSLNLEDTQLEEIPNFVYELPSLTFLYVDNKTYDKLVELKKEEAFIESERKIKVFYPCHRKHCPYKLPRSKGKGWKFDLKKENKILIHGGREDKCSRQTF